MPQVKVENVDEATIDLFQRERARFEQQYEAYQSAGHHRAAPIVIEDGEEAISDGLKQEIEDEIAQNYDIGPDVEPEVFFREAGGPDNRHEQARVGRLVQRNQPIRHDVTVPFHYVHRIDDAVTIGDLLEIRKLHEVQYGCRFLQVKAICRSVLGAVCFRGTPYTRTRNTLSMLEYRRNELVEIWNIDDDDHRD